MVCTFSAIDIQTRMEVQDLLSRFCHALDHGRCEEWQALFAPDARLDAPRFGCFKGRGEIAAIPQLVAHEGHGHWRHVFNNVVLDRLGSRTLSVAAYCVVNDWQKNGASVRCWEFRATIEKKRSWQIGTLQMQPVGATRETIHIQPSDLRAQMPERLAS